MSARIRIAVGFALVAILMTSITAFAKGGFDFIMIIGPDLKGAVRVTDTSLTEDFFTFANFSKDKTKAPTDPGAGYEITRHYLQGKSDIIFDRLHYYPETGFVFYDGIENGDSEYDDEWYTANPDIKLLFESALAIQTSSGAPVEKKQPVGSEPQSVEPVAPAEPSALGPPSLLIMMIVFTAGLVAVFALAFWRRRSSTQ